MPYTLQDYIQEMSHPNTQTQNYYLGAMNASNAQGTAEMEGAGGQRGWGAGSGVLAGANAQIYGQGQQTMSGGLLQAEQMRMQGLLPALTAQAEMEQREKERKQAMWTSILGGIGGAAGSVLGGFAGRPPVQPPNNFYWMNQPEQGGGQVFQKPAPVPFPFRDPGPPP